MIASVNSFYTSMLDDSSKLGAKSINFNLPQYYQIIHQKREKRTWCRTVTTALCIPSLRKWSMPNSLTSQVF